MSLQVLNELVKYVRTRSPFYQELYSSLPETISSIQELPVIHQERFWESNSIQENRVLTGPIHDGILFKSGGTTGRPKFSVFSKKEWRLFTQAFGNGIATGPLQSGDKIANLFYAGDLYGSFLFISNCLEQSPVDALQLPIAGSTPLEDAFRIIETYEANVLVGAPTTILNFADFVEKTQKPSGQSSIKIDRILFGGESIQAGQREKLMSIFPGVQIHSIGYASTDAGLLGYADLSCRPDEHRMFGNDTILEIIDEETGDVIHEENREGKVVVTNLTRFLMPLIRYPVGDRAIWSEFKNTKNRKFILRGRSNEAGRVGPVTVYLEDIKRVFEKFELQLGEISFQMLIVHRQMKDGLILRIATTASPSVLADYIDSIVGEIYQQKPLYLDLLKKDLLLPIEIERVDKNQLEFNSRTGKLRRIIDQRFNH